MSKSVYITWDTLLGNSSVNHKRFKNYRVKLKVHKKLVNCLHEGKSCGNVRIIWIT